MNPSALVKQFTVTVPAGTSQAAPQSTPMKLGTYEVGWAEVNVPPGPRGALGFYLAYSGVQVVPFASGGANWVVADDKDFTWELMGYPPGGDWSLVAYNLGNYAHTLQVRFGLTVPVKAAPVAALIAPSALTFGGQ